MKTYKIIAIIVLISTISTTNYAQISGFLGKRNIISGSLFMKSSFVMPNKNGKSGYYNFNDHYSIEFERVINRRHSLKLHATYFESRFDLLGLDEKDLLYLNKFSTKAFGADYLIYRNSYIAPLGAYISFGFDVFLSNVNIDTAYLNNNYYDFLNNQRFSITNSNTIHFGGNVKSGIKQIFFNCISFDFNFQLGLIAAESDAESYISDEKTFIQNRIGERLWGHYFWGINCSIGFVF